MATTLMNFRCLVLCSVVALTTIAAQCWADDAIGVRLTVTDHSHIINRIKAETGITVSPWVWDQYFEGVVHLDEAMETTRVWLQSLPREIVHGQRPQDSPPDTIWERSERLLKKVVIARRVGLAALESEYFRGLTLHQVPERVLSDVRAEVYRRRLLPENRQFPGANVDVVALVHSLNIMSKVGEDRVEIVEELFRNYGKDITELLRQRVEATAADRDAAPTMFEELYGPEVKESPLERATRRTRAMAIEGRIAVRNGQCVHDLAAVLSDNLAATLQAAWRRELYPFLWRVDIDEHVARILHAPSTDEQSLIDDLRRFQEKMHAALWNAQCRAAEYDNLIRSALGMTMDGPWQRFEAMHKECTEAIQRFSGLLMQSRNGDGQ